MGAIQFNIMRGHAQRSKRHKALSGRLVGGMIGVMSVGLCVGVGGCQGQGQRSGSRNTDKPVNAGLGQFEQDDAGLSLPDSQELIERDEFGSVRNQIEESARQLNVYFANMEIDGIDPTNPTDSTSADREPQAGGDSVTDASTQQTTEHTGAGGVGPGAVQSPGADDGADGSVRVSLMGSDGADQEVDQEDGEPAAGGDVDHVGQGDDQGEPEGHALDPVVRKEQLAGELASILKDLAATSDDPGSAALALASLETMLPGDVATLVEDGVLSDAERASIDAVRSFLGALSAEGSIASPSEVSAQLETIQRELDAWAGLNIKKVALCTRVDGFGRYETFPSYRFVAGRAQAVIVYVELERFTQREISGPDGQPRYETKLSQRLELYHVADDLNTWNRAAETVSDETRNRLRDYYLINQVTLPATLGVGRYHLKVVMRDLLGERVAETILSIEIVAR